MYLFYDKCRKSFYNEKSLEAAIAAQANFYASPSYSKTDANKKKRTWNNFIKTLDYKSITSKAKNKTVGNFKTLFSKFGVKIKGPKKEDNK